MVFENLDTDPKVRSRGFQRMSLLNSVDNSVKSYLPNLKGGEEGKGRYMTMS